MPVGFVRDEWLDLFALLLEAGSVESNFQLYLTDLQKDAQSTDKHFEPVKTYRGMVVQPNVFVLRGETGAKQQSAGTGGSLYRSCRSESGEYSSRFLFNAFGSGLVVSSHARMRFASISTTTASTRQ